MYWPVIYSLNKHAEKEAAGQQAASYVQNGRTSADMLTPPGGPPGYNYQVFKVCEERCIVLTVTIVKGMGITRGKIKDWCKYRNKQKTELEIDDAWA